MRTCGTCGRGKAVVTERGHDTGFVRCALQKPYFWFAPGQACALGQQWQPIVLQPAGGPDDLFERAAA